MLGGFFSIIFSFRLYDFVILEKSLISASIKVSCTKACSYLDPKKNFYYNVMCNAHVAPMHP